jgi:hypothetical protein
MWVVLGVIVCLIPVGLFVVTYVWRPFERSWKAEVVSVGEAEVCTSALPGENPAFPRDPLCLSPSEVRGGLTLDDLAPGDCVVLQPSHPMLLLKRKIPCPES